MIEKKHDREVEHIRKKIAAARNVKPSPIMRKYLLKSGRAIPVHVKVGKTYTGRK